MRLTLLLPQTVALLSGIQIGGRGDCTSWTCPFRARNQFGTVIGIGLGSSGTGVAGATIKLFVRMTKFLEGMIHSSRHFIGSLTCVS
jgi:hypothetical protein